MLVRLVRTALLLAACAALAIGCTSDAERRSQYATDVLDAGDVVTKALAALPTGDDRPIGPDEVRRLAEQLDTAADDLADLDPPEGAGTAQKRLIRGLRGVSTAFDDLADDLDTAKDDDQRAERFVEFANDSTTDKAFDDLAGAQDDYAAAGFKVYRDPPPELPAATDPAADAMDPATTSTEPVDTTALAPENR